MVGLGFDPVIGILSARGDQPDTGRGVRASIIRAVAASYLIAVAWRPRADSDPLHRPGRKAGKGELLIVG